MTAKIYDFMAEKTQRDLIAECNKAIEHAASVLKRDWENIKGVFFVLKIDDGSGAQYPYCKIGDGEWDLRHIDGLIQKLEKEDAERKTSS